MNPINPVLTFEHDYIQLGNSGFHLQMQSNPGLLMQGFQGFRLTRELFSKESRFQVSVLGKFADDLSDVNTEVLSHPHISVLTSQYSYLNTQGCQGCRRYQIRCRVSGVGTRVVDCRCLNKVDRNSTICGIV